MYKKVYKLRPSNYFPSSLDQFAREDVGVIVWDMENGTHIILAKTMNGFMCITAKAGVEILGVNWVKDESGYVIDTVKGLRAEDLERSGLDRENQSKRVLNVLGAITMGEGTSESITCSELEELRESIFFHDILEGWSQKHLKNFKQQGLRGKI